MILAIDKYSDKRATKWIVVCGSCQTERIVGYAQAWNIKAGNTNRDCKKCLLLSGRVNINLSGLEKGRVKHSSSKGHQNKGTLYRNIFVPVSMSTKNKQRAAKLGKCAEDANNWQGGLTEINLKVRRSAPYAAFRAAVLKRDNFKCQNCPNKHGLHVHHIQSFSKFPELRFEVGNGLTLCKSCHKGAHNV